MVLAKLKKKVSVRRILIMLSIAVLLVFVIPLTLLWFIITQPVFSSGAPRSSVQVDPEILEAHVRMLSETLVPRDYAHVENLDRVADYIREEFAKTGGRVSDQVFQADGETYRNVLLQFGPSTGERIVVGAHYDAAGGFPAADDNASGVAALIELAHLLDKESLPLTVELAAYSLEEPPFFRTPEMGSAVHAASLKKEGVSVRLMIALDMLGYYDDTPGSQTYPLPALKAVYPSEGNFIAVVGDLGSQSEVRRVKKAMLGATELPVYSVNAPRRMITGIDWSDHLNFWNNGYPAVMISDTSFLRNGKYHTAEDTPDRLDYQRMRMVTIGLYEAVLKEARTAGDR